ncbi:hypothetical protein HAP94_00710 [Acidithiobacillus ferrivorans]|nr:hypothetical protein [Acidithiobacillus ferrivorans]
MEKKLSLRLDQGLYMVIEANAQKQEQTVSDWIRAAIQDHIKRSVNNRVLDRLDERTYSIQKDMVKHREEVLKMLEQVRVDIADLTRA